MTHPRVAFIGLGHMGGHMCRNVITAGFEVTALDLDPEALARSANDGARPASSVTDCIADAEILVTSLPGPAQVDAVLCGDGNGNGGAIAAMAPGSLVVEMSTSSLEIGRKTQAAAAAAGAALIDAPVAGQTIGAEAGTLAIYAGGEADAFARALPLLEAMGDPERIFHLGPARQRLRGQAPAQPHVVHPGGRHRRGADGRRQGRGRPEPAPHGAGRFAGQLGVPGA